MGSLWRWIGGWLGGEGDGDDPRPTLPDPAGGLSPAEEIALMMWSADSANRERVERAAGAIRRLIRQHAPGELARLDEQVRAELAAPLRGVPELVLRLSAPAADEPYVLGAFSFHADGYVREAAVRRLTLLGAGEELPFLLLRANDWVHAVRHRAMDALSARLLPRYAPAFVGSLELVLRLRECGRADHASLIVAVLDLLRTPEARPAVLAGIGAPNRAVARACHRLLAEQDGADGLEEVVRAGLESPDPVVRLYAARSAEKLGGPVLRELLPAMLADPAGPVRAVAVGVAWWLGAEAEPWLRRAALDARRAVRWQARASLRKLGPVDFAAFYREALGDGRATEGAVAGLAETGGEEDAPLVARFLDDPRPRVRAEALRAYAKLAGGRAAVPALLTAVEDASPRVSHAARVGLEPVAQWLDEAHIAGWMEAGRPRHVRLAGLSLLARRPRWDALPWIVAAFADEDERVAAAGRVFLNRWRGRFNRGSTAITPAQGERVRQALDRYGDRLSPETLRWLRFVST